MAKNSDHLDSFDSEDTGGLFSSLLADEDDFDRRRTLWRVASWGVGSVAAIVIAVMANQSSLGLRREQAQTADLVQQANRLQSVARDSQNEARRLASAVETLNNDRDRLYTRVTVLEQGLDSVTGAIARQSASPTPSTPPDPQPAAQTPAPPIAPVATKPATQPEKATAAASADPSPATTSAVKEVPIKASAMATTPLVESKSIMAPPDPAAGKLIEPSKPEASKPDASKPDPSKPEPSKTAGGITSEPIPTVIAASPFGENAEQETADAALPKVQRTEFGVDVGGANSIAGLRALWKGLLKSRSNAPLAALQPLIVIREGAGGRGMQLRLVAGPLADAAAAAKLCAVMTENDRDCETTVYDGQRLTLKADEAPAAAKPVAPAAPATSRKKNAPQKRAAVEEPAKKPESSGWSSFFGKKN